MKVSRRKTAALSEWMRFDEFLLATDADGNAGIDSVMWNFLTSLQGNLRYVFCSDPSFYVIDTFMDNLGISIDTMYLLRVIMYQAEDLSDQQIEDFTRATHFLGDQFRNSEVLNLSVTVKLHLLESHAPLMAVQYRRLNEHIEEPIEREHREWNELQYLAASATGRHGSNAFFSS